MRAQGVSLSQLEDGLKSMESIAHEWTIEAKKVHKGKVRTNGNGGIFVCVDGFGMTNSLPTTAARGPHHCLYPFP